MKFTYYRLFVEHTSQIGYFSDLSKTKKDILKQAFDHDQPVYFRNRGQTYVYKRIAIQGDVILSKIAKSTTVPVEHPAEENFAVEHVTSWPGVHMIINMSDHPKTGQSVAVESDKSVFADTITQLNCLVAMVNKVVLNEHSVEILVNPITLEHDFWQVVSDHKGKIRSLTLNFASPNLFKTEDALNEDLRAASEQFGNTNTSVKLENPEGNLQLPKSNRFLTQSLKYITAGGGTFKIKTKGRKIISSEDTTAAKDFEGIEDVDLKDGVANLSTAKELCDRLFSWLGQRD